MNKHLKYTHVQNIHKTETQNIVVITNTVHTSILEAAYIHNKVSTVLRF